MINGKGPEIQVSNWGRWGSQDERGTLNLLTPAVVRQAASLVKTGRVYTLAVPLDAEGPQYPSRHKTWRVTKYHGEDGRHGGADDVVMLHSHSGTHLDALCHIWYDDRLYNGFRASEHITSRSATRNSIDRVGWIVGRGILLDIASCKGVSHLELGEGISAVELEDCAARQALEVRPGDLVLVRTGWMQVFSQDRSLFDRGAPGLDPSTLAWLKDNDIVLIGADNHGVEQMTSIPPAGIPLHRGAIRDLGLYLLENLYLEDLARERVYEFLMVVAPLPLSGGAGSPVNPIAIA